MKLRHSTVLGALAVASLLAVGSTARADYSYSLNSFTFPGGTPAGIAITGTTGTLPDSTPSSPVIATFAYTSPATGVYALSFSEHITSATLGTEDVTIAGTLTILFSSPGTVISTFVPSSGGSTTPYLVPFTFANYITSVTGTTATLSIAIVPNAVVPEPASIAMLGLGLVSFGGVALRRRMAK